MNCSPETNCVPVILCSQGCSGTCTCSFNPYISAYIFHMDHSNALREALSDDGDIELRFQGGHSIPVHSLKLKLASSVLKDLINATLDDQIASAAAKRRKTADGGRTAGQQDMPYVQVSLGMLVERLNPHVLAPYWLA